MSVLVGRQAPGFTAAAVLGDGSVKDNLRLADDLAKHAAAL